MSAPDFSPLNPRFDDILWLNRAGDTVLAEHHAHAAATADTADDCEFHCDMTYLYAMRAHITGQGNDDQ